MPVAFLAYPEMSQMLVSELKSRFNMELSDFTVYGDLFYTENVSPFACEKYPYWARTTAINPKFQKFESIGEAAKFLKAIQRNWASYQFSFFRRSSLIQEKLPFINLKPKSFPFEIPSSQIGLFTLIDENKMLYSETATSPLPSGYFQFIEDHENPPSRAYLKLQEALVRFAYFYKTPLPDEKSYCFDAGACPGGWTWVLRQLGSRVFAVDRAELCDSLMNDSSVEFLKHDAFTLETDKIGPFDFVFSDVICYPERLLNWVNLWIESGRTKNMICTIKMQGEIDWDLVEKFASIPDSHVVHLCYNKHELTWMWHKD
ncbi:MAG: SAM-dependent methyltransferase [Treponemataceae bacterium]|nr:SAM-dependent methyltransferase [Treponemataceae bacterium]